MKHIANVAASAADIVDAEARGSTAGVAATAAGDNRRNRLLNVAMRSKAAAAAVEGSNYEDEVCMPGDQAIACIHKAKWTFSRNRFPVFSDCQISPSVQIDTNDLLEQCKSACLMCVIVPDPILSCPNLATICVSISYQADAEADAKAMEQAMSIWNLEFHDPILETVSSRIRKKNMGASDGFVVVRGPV